MFGRARRRIPSDAYPRRDNSNPTLLGTRPSQDSGYRRVAENVNRDGLTFADEADDYRLMRLEGMSVARIARLSRIRRACASDGGQGS